MILSDIINARVEDEAGHPLGYAIDARFVLDGVPTQLLAGAVLTHIMISPKTGSSFFGYERSGVSSPWPLGALLKRRHRAAFFAAWSDVARVDSDLVVLRDTYTRLPISERD